MSGDLQTSDLKADPANRRRHPARNVSMMTASLRDVGAARSIVIDETDTVLAGNGIVAAAAGAGISTVRVIEAEGDELIAVRRRGLSDEQKRRLAMYDNRTSELAEWNVDQLRLDQSAGLDIATFFDPDELAEFFGKAPRKGADPDAVPAVRATDIQPGDLFELGAHRLACGDSAHPETIARLTLGDPGLDALFTSPPYNVGVNYATHDDDTVPLADYFAWMRTLVDAWVAAMRSGRAFVWNVGVSPKTAAHHHAAMLEAAGLTLARQFVWKKVGVPVPAFHNTRTNPRVRYLTSNYTHELVYVFATGGALEVGGSHPYASDVLEHDVFVVQQTLATVDLPNVGSEKSGAKTHLETRAFKAHPAAFPVALVEAFLQHYAGPDELVGEPFGGSGTTMIACEEMGLRCRSVDVAPTYCQVAIDRWEAFTGRTAAKVGEAVR